MLSISSRLSRFKVSFVFNVEKKEEKNYETYEMAIEAVTTLHFKYTNVSGMVLYRNG